MSFKEKILFYLCTKKIKKRKVFQIFHFKNFLKNNYFLTEQLFLFTNIFYTTEIRQFPENIKTLRDYNQHRFIIYKIIKK